MDGYQQFEHIKIQFMAQLASLSHQLQQASQIADQYHNIVQHMPYTGNGVAVAPPAAGSPVATSAPAPARPGRKRKVAADADGEDGERDGRRRRKREPKDPNRPKRPPSAYLFYQNEVRGELKQAHPYTPHHELLGMIAKQWSVMTDEEKKPYEDKNKAAKAHYDTNITQYNLQNGVEPKQTKKTQVQIPVAAPVLAVVETTASSPTEESTAEASEEEESEEVDESEDEGTPAPAPAPEPTKKPKSKTPATPATAAAAKAKKDKKVKA